MASALGGFVGGLQQGYAFVDDIQRKKADDARRDKEDGRRDQDQAFQQETQGRTRLGWEKEDQYKAEVDSLNGSFFPAEHKPVPEPAIGMQQPPTAPSAAPAPLGATAAPGVPLAPAAPTAAAVSANVSEPAIAPEPAGVSASVPAAAAAVAAPAPAAAIAAPGATASLAAPPAFAAPLGMAATSTAGANELPAPAMAPAGGLPPQPNKLTSMSDSLNYLIQRAQIDIRHGKTDGAGIANLYKLQHSAAKEGLNDAVQLLSQGDNEGAMKRFNETGDMKDWHVKSSVDGVFEHGGVKIPTKIVTVQGTDGSIRTVNTAQTLVQNQLIDAIVAQAQKGVSMDDTRTDAKEGRKIQKQNADTQERYRQDQADNMEEQRRLQARTIDGKAPGAAPIWAKEDDEFLKDQYSGKDEVTGIKVFDGEGMQFAKAVAVARSRFNGGDASSASAYALTADANLKVQAKGDAAKLRQLRQQALAQLAPAPAQSRPAPAGGAEWESINARSRAGAPQREDDRRRILEDELSRETDPVNIDALNRELRGLGPTSSSAAPASGNAAPAPAPRNAARSSVVAAANPTFAVGGLSSAASTARAAREAEIARFNKTVGGGSMRDKFESGEAARRADLAANFDNQLAAIKPGMPRKEAMKVLAWFTDQADAGTMSNKQLKQLRDARVAAHL